MDRAVGNDGAGRIDIIQPLALHMTCPGTKVMIFEERVASTALIVKLVEVTGNAFMGVT